MNESLKARLDLPGKSKTRTFQFGAFTSSIHIGWNFPSAGQIAKASGREEAVFRPLFICDENTRPLAEKIAGRDGVPGKILRCVLKPGESAKNWDSVEAILRAAAAGGLGRDGVFIGVGGGVVSDLAAFAASIYARGCGLCLVPTTLLGMVDASLGGKTGFNLLGLKNAAGSFYPASHIYMPLKSLETLPPGEWKSGMAELIKTAVLEGEDLAERVSSLARGFPPASFTAGFPGDFIRRLLKNGAEELSHCVFRAAEIKGRVVESDPRETGGERRLLNLGHSFGHALESSAGLGTITHGEAVAWGLARACELGHALGITPRERAEKIIALLRSFGYQLDAPHPLMSSEEAFQKALAGDKKKTAGKILFVVPNARSACTVPAEDKSLVKKIITGSYSKNSVLEQA
jgi:3-dehydroquinate synthase